MYIVAAYKGMTEAWRYVVGFLAVFFCWQFIGGLPLIAALILKSDSLSAIAGGDLGVMAEILGTNTFLFLMLLTFAIGLVSLFAYVKWVHKQSITSLTTSRKKVDWGRIVLAFTLWAVISTAFILIDVQIAPEDYRFNFKPGPFMALLVIVILLLPVQTSMEEYYIRGYMMQGLGILARNRWLPLVVTSLLFGIMHIFNPEVAKLGYGILVFYIGTGFFLGILTLMDEGLELALGFHAANNMTAALLVTADWTAFQTDSIYRDVSDPVLGWDVLIPVFVVYPILLLLFAKKYNWTDWKTRLFGKVPTREELLALAANDAEAQETPRSF